MRGLLREDYGAVRVGRIVAQMGRRGIPGGRTPEPPLRAAVVGGTSVPRLLCRVAAI
ncbi:hypothetical protein LEN_3250 [Lysobacter enzymogenes]|uniref:Transposase n=1 Tax=Lysobacter enzymogenes TaxID=69 RepID=A0AAU9AHS2_LYSEN|nr:hypothetical protein LEN_3250 [Lysobacter enzymogenes]